MDEQAESAKDRRTRTPVLPGRAADYARLGAWLRRQRLERGLGQKDVSRSIGKSEQFLNRVEAGTQRIDLVEFFDLARVLGLPPELTLGEILEEAAKDQKEPS